MAVLALVAPSESPTLALDWSAPLECPTHEDLRAQVHRSLPPTSKPLAPLHAVVRVAAAQDGYVVHLRIEGHGRRTLEAESCAEAMDATALIIAMAIDDAPPAAIPAAQPEPSPEPTTGLVPSQPNAAQPTRPSVKPTAQESGANPPPVDQPTPTPTPTIQITGRLAGGLGVGPLPSAGLTMAAAAGLGGHGWRAELALGMWPATSGRLAARPDVGVGARLWSVGARGCGVPTRATLSFPLCAGLDVGRVRAAGEGDIASRVAFSPWIAFVAGAGATWWWSRFVGIGARVDGHISLRRPRFHTEPQATPIHEASLVGLQALLGLSLRGP